MRERDVLRALGSAAVVRAAEPRARTDKGQVPLMVSVRLDLPDVMLHFMCGRFVQLPLMFPDRSPWPELADDLVALTAKYNLAPTQRAAVVMEADGQLAVKKLRWGLLPPW